MTAHALKVVGSFESWLFAFLNGFFREQGRQGRGTIMNLELRNSGTDENRKNSNRYKDGVIFVFRVLHSSSPFFPEFLSSRFNLHSSVLLIVLSLYPLQTARSPNLYQPEYSNSPSHEQPRETSHLTLWVKRYHYTVLNISDSKSSPL
jgi:hypothetical protein